MATGVPWGYPVYGILKAQTTVKALLFPSRTRYLGLEPPVLRLGAGGGSRSSSLSYMQSNGK